MERQEQLWPVTLEPGRTLLWSGATNANLFLSYYLDTVSLAVVDSGVGRCRLADQIAPLICTVLRDHHHAYEALFSRADSPIASYLSIVCSHVLLQLKKAPVKRPLHHLLSPGELALACLEHLSCIPLGGKPLHSCEQFYRV